MAEVVFSHVTKRFPNVEALKDFNLRIPDREFLVLVGPSGCGKSTALRLLAGLEEVTEGDIYIGERRVNQVPAKKRDIAMVFQSYALYPHMTVYDNMAFSLSLRKMDKRKIKEKVQEAAKILGIEELLGRKPKLLSGGQQQRAALGRAIVREPAVFLFDEPLSNLDAKLRVQTRSELIKLQRRLGTTFVYVTHDQVEAMTMATRIAVMEQGIIHQVGDPQTLYEQPKNVFVAGFIGSPAMNFLEARVVRNGEALYVEQDDFRAQIPGEKADPLESYVDKRIIFGIRPENIYDPEFLPPGIEASRVKTTVDVTELMGNEIFLYLKLGEAVFLARIDPRTQARSGDEIKMAFDMSRMHAFDPDTQESILVSATSRNGGEETE